MFDWPSSNNAVKDASATFDTDTLYGRWNYDLVRIAAGGGNNVINGSARVKLNVPNVNNSTMTLVPGNLYDVESSAFQGVVWGHRDMVGPCGTMTGFFTDFIYCTQDSDCVGRGDTCDLTTKTCKCGSSGLCSNKQSCTNGLCV